MRITYTPLLARSARPSWLRGGGGNGRALVLATVTLCAVFAACATGGGSGLPRGGSRLAAGSTPEPVRYEVVVVGSRARVLDWVARVLSDSLFHVAAADSSTLLAYNLARLVKVRAEMLRSGSDSTQVSLTGETYLGDTTRRDSVSGLPERWRLITPSDPSAAALLRGLARAMRQARFETGVGGRGSGGGGGSGGGEPPVSRVDSTTIAAMLATPVGRALDVCRSTAVPAGWLVLYWYTAPTRCQGLADERYAGEPNVMRIEREW